MHHVTSLPVAYRERVSQSWELPHGRICTAVLQVPVWLAATAVGGCESVQPFRLQAEVRQSDAEAYEMVSDTDWQTEPGTYRLQLPQAAEPDPNKPFARKPVFRLRLSHKGAHDPQLKLGVEGI